MTHLLHLLSFVITLIFCRSSQSEAYNRLEAIQVKNPFLDPVFFSTPYYDGESDTIYLFGGLSKILPYNMIAGFSISNSSLWKAGDLPLYDTGSKSPLLPSPHGSHFFYFTANDFNSTNIQKFNPVDGSIKQVGIMPFSTAISSSVNKQISSKAKANGGKFYLFGGKGLEKDILELDITKFADSEDELFEWKVVGSLSQVFTASASASVGNKVFIFGATEETNKKTSAHPYIILDLETLAISEPPGQFVKFNGAPSVVKGSGDDIYIIGGYAEGAPTNGIIKMNAKSLTWEFLPVDNFPIDSRTEFLIAPAMVFVEHLNRLYFFGGLDGTLYGPVNFRNDIWYVDLDPMDTSVNFL